MQSKWSSGLSAKELFLCLRKGSISDIDLAVQGLEPNSYWEAWRVAEEEMIDYPVDLVEIESASESLRQAIDKYGIEL